MKRIENIYKDFNDIKRMINSSKPTEPNTEERSQVQDNLRGLEKEADEAAVKCRKMAAAYALIKGQWEFAAAHPWAPGNAEIPDGFPDVLSDFPEIPRPLVPPFPKAAAFWP